MCCISSCVSIITICVFKVTTRRNLINSSNDSYAQTGKSMLEEELYLLILSRLDEINQRHTFSNRNNTAINLSYS